MKKTGHMDNVDKKILKEVVKDARLSSRKISKHAGVSHQTILSRLKRMEKSGVISGYLPLVEFKKLGFEEVTLLVKIAGKQKKSSEEFRELLSHPNIVLVKKLVGDYELMLKVVCPTESYEEVVSDIKSRLDSIYRIIDISSLYKLGNEKNMISSQLIEQIKTK